MYRDALIVIWRRLFGRPRALAYWPASLRIVARIAVVLLAIPTGQVALASVLVSGNVIPTNNPFTPVDEGMPTDGNFVNPFELPDHQTYYEGRHDDAGPGTADDFNVNFNIIVGQTSSGTLLISGESALRDMNLVIGDSGLLGGQTRYGTGIVRITGFGSLFNNNPLIIPAGLPSNFSSVNPRTTAGAMDGLDDFEDGFDVYVGRAGIGTLEISAGARAEIHDAVIVGDLSGSTGNIIVDGFDSFLGNGGYVEGGATGTAIHQMIVGHLGIGYMTISNGATVASEAPPDSAGSSNIGPIGAVIGSDPFSFTEGQVPDPGGSGTVTVMNTASKWVIGGSLQVGGFDLGLEGMTIGDPEGDDVVYSSQVGRGTLYVQDGGIVNIRNAIGVADPTTTDLLLAIGRFGRVELAGGLINIGGVPPGTTDESRPDTVQVINDGVIAGSGRIDTGVFRNRYLGEVRVGAGETLIIDSSAQFSSGALDQDPLVNYGLIEVIGTEDLRAELEFIRAPDAPMNPIRPFLNLPLPVQPAPPAFDGGLISAQHATLRFGSGIENFGVMGFTAGSNIIRGEVANIGLDARFIINGPETVVVFEDDLSAAAAAVISLEDGGDFVVLDRHSFATDAVLNMDISTSNPSHISVAGDIGLSGILNVSLASDVLSSLSHGDSFEIISFTDEAYGVVASGMTVIPDVTNPILPFGQGFNAVNVSPDLALLFPALDPLVQRIGQGIYLSFLDPSMVGGGGGAIGPDFNGDGVVDALDLAIWQANVGITMGASVLQGDADGDGDVDGDDFLFWQRNAGQPPPWNGAGAGAGGGAGTAASVPEPSCLALLLTGGILVVALRRGRTAC